MTTKMIISPEGLQKLKKELSYLKKDRRAQIAERITAAKEFGDLSENAEYHDAREEQSFIEGRILEIEHIIKTADVADTTFSTNIIVGSTVTLDRSGVESIFQIVGATEADPAAGKISLDSPLGRELMDKAIGEKVSVVTPSGTISYTIKGIR